MKWFGMKTLGLSVGSFAVATIPAIATAQVPVVPTLPQVVPQATVSQPLPLLPAPVPLPRLSTEQSAWLIAWLNADAGQGLGSRPFDATAADNDALIRAALDHARALHSGRIDDADFLTIWALRPEVYDPLPTFAQALANNGLDRWAASLTPRYAGYEGLRKGLANYERVAASGGWPMLSAKSPSALVRARLAVEDKSVVAATKLVDAIQSAQRRYGLNPTGTLDARTLTALNVPVRERIAAIKANMERWRWLPRA